MQYGGPAYETPTMGQAQLWNQSTMSLHSNYRDKAKMEEPAPWFPA